MQYKKLTFIMTFTVFAILFVSTTSYSYYNNEDESKVKPYYISMLFHRLSGKKPDFIRWIEEEPEYQTAPRLERLGIQQDLYRKLEEKYKLMNPKEPITIKFKTKISKYSTKNQGFFIDSLQADLFFNYEYMGESFAVIPKDIDNYQWFSLPISDIEDAELDLNKENDITIRITLVPQYADDSSTVHLGFKKYWMILTKVSSIELWSANDTQLLWRGKSKAGNGHLLDLYR